MQIRRGYRKGKKWEMNEDRIAIYLLQIASARVLKYQGQIMGYLNIYNTHAILRSDFKI